jgi:hypothetical protein
MPIDAVGRSSPQPFPVPTPESSSELQQAAERALAPLVGLALWGPARESNMLSLQCGEAAAPHDGVASFLLEIFCPWRLAQGATIVAGSGDLYTPADAEADLETFELDEPGSTWWDLRLRDFFESHESPLRVEGASADHFGGFRLACTGGLVLDVFPNSSIAPHVETEFWRLLRPGESTPHFVVDTVG